MKSRRTNLYRQGDILFKSIGQAPKGKKQVREDGIVAEGEATGHMHRVENTNLATVFAVGQQMIVAASKPVRIVHEEHNPLVLPAGNYQVVRQRESRGAMGGVQRVAD